MKILQLIKKYIRLFVALAIASTAFVLTKITHYVYVAELISLVPFRTGNLARYYFYKWTLSECGDDVVIGFGTIISYQDATIGNHVSIGPYNTFGHVDIGDYALTAQACHFLSGSHTHGTDRLDIPIMQQAGCPERIKIGPDIWCGANVTVMANIGEGCVIGAGSVVTKDIPDYSVAVGNPARIIRNRNVL